MVSEGKFDQSNLVDQIAFLAIYFVPIRREIHGFVRLWNIHKIRRQRNRPNCISGKPWMLYHYPGEGVRDYQIPVNRERLQQYQDYFRGWGIFPKLYYLARTN